MMPNQRRSVFPAGLLLAGAVFFVSLAQAQISIHGRVLAGDGAPVARATVTLSPIASAYDTARQRLEGGQPEPPISTSPDRQGRFELLAPEAGLWTVRAEAPGVVPVELPLLPLLGEITLPDARLEADAGLTIRVADAEGRPVGAEVVARWPGPSSPATAMLFFDELLDGRWRPADRRATAEEGIARMARGASETLLVQARGLPVAPEPTDAGSPSGVAGLTVATAAQDVVLPGVRERLLRVVGPRNRPLAEIVIATADAVHPLALTGDDGQARVALPPSGTVELTFLGPHGERWERALDLSHHRAPSPKPLTVELDEPARASGTVLDARTQRPIAGAWVWISGAAGDRVSTDARGRFSIPSRKGSHLLFAAAPGHVRALAELTRGQGVAGPHVLQLTPMASLAGRVVDATDRPLPEVHVGVRLDLGRASAAARGMGPRSWATETGRDGRFELSGLPRGEPHVLTLTRDGFARAEVAVDSLEADGEPLRIVLRQGIRGVGRVVDPSRRPIAGAEVELQPAEKNRQSPAISPDELLFGDEPVTAAAVSDAGGRFEIPGLAPGTYDLEARAPSFARLRKPGLVVDGTLDELDLGTLTLTAGVEIEGRVVDTDGSPLTGAQIRAIHAEGLNPTEQYFQVSSRPVDVRTGDDGLFRLENLPPGTPLAIRVDKDGYAAKHFDNLRAPELEAVPAEPVEIVLASPGRLHGRVLDESGSPVAGAVVKCQLIEIVDRDGGISLPMKEGQVPRTDAEGHFEIKGLPAGHSRLMVFADGYQPHHSIGFDVPAGGEPDAFEVILKPAAVLEGRVTDPAGEPLAGVWVRIFAEGRERVLDGAKTDPSGRYRAQRLAPGVFTASVQHPGYARILREVEIQPGVNTADFAFEGGADVSGRVTSAAGEAVGDASVRLESRPDGSRSRYTKSRSDGSFHIPNVAAGSYVLGADKDGYYRAGEGEALTVAASSLDGLEVRLSRGARLHGRLDGVDAEDLDQLRVAARRPGKMVSGTVGSDGYEILGIPPGDWTVQASVQDAGRMARRKITVPEGAAEVELDLAFVPGLVLEGEISLDGEAVRGARLFLLRLDEQASAQSLSGNDGRFRFENLEAGLYRLSVQSLRAEITYRKELRLDADRELHIELAHAARITGQVLHAFDRSPLASVRLELTPLDPGGQQAPRRNGTDSHGAFVIEGVAEGPWRLTAEKPGFAPATTTVVTVSGETAAGLELLLSPAAGLTFEAVDALTGQPFATVRAAVLDGAGARVTAGRFQAAGGKVRITTVPEGTWELLVQTDSSSAVRRRALAPGDAGRVELPPGATVEISVPALASSPGARITLEGPGGAPYRWVEWDGEPRDGWPLWAGRATLHGVPAGTWTLRATAPDGVALSRPLTVSSGAKLDITIE